MGRVRRVYICYPVTKRTYIYNNRLEEIRKSMRETYGYMPIGPFKTIGEYLHCHNKNAYDCDKYTRMHYLDEVLQVVSTCKAIYMAGDWERDQYAKLVFNYATKNKYEIILDKEPEKDSDMLALEQHFGFNLEEDDEELTKEKYRVRVCYIMLKVYDKCAVKTIAKLLRLRAVSVYRIIKGFDERVMEDEKLRATIYEVDKLLNTRNLVKKGGQ